MIIGNTLIGSGDEKVVVLHGWLGDYAVWEPTFNSLDTQTFTYCFVDYRGYGKSSGMTGDYSMTEIAEDAIALIDKLGWDRFHIIGHSMGGMAAQRLATLLDDPARVKSIVGVDPVPACGAQLDEPTWELFSGAIENDGNRYQILDFTTGNRNSEQWLSWMVERSRASTTVPAFSGYLDAWVKENFADEVEGCAVPLLVILGEHDLAFNEEAMQATHLTWFPNSELQVVANAGHYPMQEAPVNLATMIQAFMKKHT
jgi:pimeloyl-ACP methyl ester carboxylesterase